MVAGAVAETGSVVAAPLAPITATLGVITFAQGVDGFGRAFRYFGSGDSDDPLTSADSSLSDLETAHSLGSLGGSTTSEVIVDRFSPVKPAPTGIFTKLGKGLAVSTLVSAIPTKAVCDTYDQLKDLATGNKKKKGKDPKCP